MSYLIGYSTNSVRPVRTGKFQIYITYRDSGTAPTGIRAASEGRAGVSLKGKNAVKTTAVDPAIAAIKTLREGGG